MLPQKAEVVVIGGGVIGASVAYYLSKEGVDTVLLERSSICSNTSGSCEGFVFMQSKKPGVHLAMAMESARLFEGLEHELGSDIEYVNCGGMVVIETEEELDAMERYVESQREIGLEVSLLDGEEARTREPVLSPDIMGATYSPLDSQVNPMFLTFAFIDRARELGLKVFADTEALAVKVARKRVRAVVTPRGEIETGVVVNAAGPFASHVGRMVGLEVDIKPRRGQLLVSEATPRILSTVMLSARYIAAKFNPELADKGGQGISIEQTVRGNIVMGSTREFAGYNRGVTEEGMAGIARRVSEIMPRLANIHIIRSFAGLRPFTPDGMPILGNVKGVGGFVMAAGHEGDGIALSPITGKLTAELITRGRTGISLDAFSLERFL